MAFKDMREFLELLEKQGELVRIKAPVSRDLEITEIADRVMKGRSAKNKALLFENVQGFSSPVAINLFGSDRLASRATRARASRVSQRPTASRARRCRRACRSW